MRSRDFEAPRAVRSRLATSGSSGPISADTIQTNDPAGGGRAFASTCDEQNRSPPGEQARSSAALPLVCFKTSVQEPAKNPSALFL